jgi:hypothetical protein
MLWGIALLGLNDKIMGCKPRMRKLVLTLWRALCG